MKKLVLICSFLLMFLFLPFTVNAEEVVVNNLTELNQVIQNGGEAKLGNNITLTGNTFLRKNLTLDLNGHTLNTGSGILIPLSTFTVKDTGTNGKITSNTSFVFQIGATSTEGNLILESGTIEGPTYGINIVKGTMTVNGGEVKANNYTICNRANLVINGGKVYATHDYAIANDANSNTIINDGYISSDDNDRAVTLASDCSLTMNGGTIEAIHGGAGISAYKNTTVVINGGTIRATESALMGNGSTSGSNEGTNAKFTIKGGNLISLDEVAIYAPQKNGETIITGGTISGGKTALEVRAGNVKISGGVFDGNKDEFYAIDVGSGTSSKGAAVALIQHWTKQPINVEICGGTFNAYLPIVKANPLNLGEEDLEKVVLTIPEACSKLEVNSTGEKVVDGLDLKNFIKSGSYNLSVPAEYLVEGYGEFYNGRYNVNKYYNITVQGSENGETKAKEMGIVGEEIEITATPKLNYQVDSIEVIDEQGNKIEVTDNKFIMPNSNVTVKVNYGELINPPTSDHYKLHIILVMMSLLGLLVIGKKSLA